MSPTKEDDMSYHEIHQNRKYDTYIYACRLRERQSNMRLAIPRYQGNIVSPREGDDISRHEIHQKQN